MVETKNYSILFIKDERSKFDEKTKAFDQFFKQADVSDFMPEALKSYEKNKHDVVLIDLSADPEKVVGVTKIKREKQDQIIFALMDPKDTQKLYKIADSGIHAIELTADQFDKALEMIANFDPVTQS